LFGAKDRGGQTRRGPKEEWVLEKRATTMDAKAVELKKNGKYPKREQVEVP